MLPSELVLDRSVRSGDLASTNLPLFILRCEDRKAVGYAEDKLEKKRPSWPRRDGGNLEEIYNQRLNDMVIGLRLADAPPAVSYLAILGGAHLHGEIVAIDKTVIVIRMGFTCEGGSSSSYLIYDAVALSLRMIPAPDPSWHYTLSSSVSVARPCRGLDYALVHTGRLGARGQDSFSLWRPSSSSPPWSEYKKASFLHRNGWSETDTPFSFNGHTYRVDLLHGVFCSSCDALFDDNDNTSSVMMKFIPLPVEPRSFDQRKPEPDAYRTMGVIRDSFIRFVSIDGIHEYVELKDRTMTVWKLVDQEKGYWEKEHDLSMETLWGFEGFGDVPKDLTPMYPLMSTNDTDVFYLGLGGYRETKIVRGSLPIEWEFLPYYPRYMLAVDMRNKIVRTSINLEGNKPTSLVSCGLSRYLRKALLGPCDDEGVPIPGMKKPKRKKKHDGGNVAETPIPMKKNRRRKEEA